MPNQTEEEEITLGDEVFVDLSHLNGPANCRAVVIEEDPTDAHDYTVLYRNEEKDVERKLSIGEHRVHGKA